MKKQNFEEVMSRELDVLMRVATRLTRNVTDAEDLVGQALFKAARAWETFDGTYPRAWLIRILRNEFLIGKRKSTYGVVVDSIETELSEPATLPAEIPNDLETKITAEEILKAIDELPEEFRSVIVLCDVEECTYEEVSVALQIPVGTVRSRLHRSRHWVRNQVVAWGAVKITESHREKAKSTSKAEEIGTESSTNADSKPSHVPSSLNGETENEN